MNMKIVVRIREAMVIPGIEMLLNPAVLGVMDAKNELVTLSIKLIFPMVKGFEYSKMKIRKAPPKIKIKVAEITSLECSDNFLMDR